MLKQIVLFNPFTGKPRDPRDIRSDPYGSLIWDGETPLMAVKRSVSREEVTPRDAATH